MNSNLCKTIFVGSSEMAMLMRSRFVGAKSAKSNVARSQTLLSLIE
ncbi:MAG: hypothetical protein HC769_24635 [Cyanobacteria bacterium CRU_2_1]|nr:hypothetical protein [Cyanobacteria bacterium CRU_2_1]